VSEQDENWQGMETLKYGLHVADNFVARLPMAKPVDRPPVVLEYFRNNPFENLFKQADE